MNGKKALITGSSRGIGRAIAIKLAKDGYDIILHYAGNEKKAKETELMIKENGGNVTVVKADLCDINAVKTLAEKIEENGHIWDIQMCLKSANFFSSPYKWKKIGKMPTFLLFKSVQKVSK